MVITDIFKNRWRTLMSVDDVVAAVIAEVDALGLSDSTYFFYSSDHGFQVRKPLRSKFRTFVWLRLMHPQLQLSISSGSATNGLTFFCACDTAWSVQHSDGQVRDSLPSCIASRTLAII